MNQLMLSLLGGFAARIGSGPPIAVPTRKAQALFAYLALTADQTHPRDKLAALLWPDTPPAAARNALRQTLFVLRKALGPTERGGLVMRGDAITLAAGAVQTDVVVFEQAVAEGTPSGLDRAAGLYRGDLLAGLGVIAPTFEDWLMSERERLRELALEAFARLLAHQRAVGALAPAVQSALRLLALDPLQEAVHRALMRLYVQFGRRDTALRQYQECVEILRRELAVEPESETRELYQEILRQRRVREATPSIGINPSDPPLVGREVELERLHETLAEGWAGGGRVVAVIGEAGIGKSRLLAELAAEASRRGGGIVLGRAYESEQILPLGPLIGALRDGGVLTDPKLLGGLEGAWRAELARLLPEITGTGRPLETGPPDQMRLFEALAHLLRRIALDRPLVVVLEDCHWADDMTLRFLAFCARRLHSAPILLAISVRDEEVLPESTLHRTLEELATEDRLLRVPLSRLGRDQTLALVRVQARPNTAAALLTQRGEEIWGASEGNPFIVLETTRAISEGAAIASPGRLPLPARVRDMIAQRLDRLSDRGQELAQVAAVIEREFEFALLHQASGLDERSAAQGVEELVRRRVLRAAGERFELVHERIREVVWDRLLTPRRRLLHGAVAGALEALAGGNLSHHCAALGAHYREAGVWDKAVVFLREAGRQATERCAYREAALVLDHARGALAHLPESHATLEQEFELRLELRNALLPLGDFSVIMQHLRDAATVAKRLADGPRRVRTAGLLMGQLWMLGDHAAALEEGREALPLAEELGDPGLLVLIRMRLGETRHVRGEYREAATLFTQNIEALTGAKTLERFGLLQPPAVHSRTWLMYALAEQGRFVEARAVAADALAIARQVDQPVALSFAWAGLGAVALQQGEWGEAIVALERALEMPHGDFAPWLPRFTGALGHAYAVSGQAARGLGLLGQALDQGVAIGVRGARSMLVAWQAEARLLAGDVRGALDTAAEAVALAQRHGERGHAAWGLRALAEAEGRADDARPAARSYEEAVALAGELGMRPLVAHCRLGLGTLYARADQRAQARVELAAAHDLFAEMGLEHWRARTERALAGSG